jgi:hypothetical protein
VDEVDEVELRKPREHVTSKPLLPPAQCSYGNTCLRIICVLIVMSIASLMS